MAHRDRVGARGQALAAHVGEQARDFVLVDLVEFGAHVLARVEDVFAEEVLRDGSGGGGGGFGVVLVLGVQLAGVFGLHGRGVGVGGVVVGGGGVGAGVGGDDEVGEALVVSRVNGVADDAEDVEAGEDGLGELDVLAERDGAVVAAADGVGGGDDGAAGLERRDDAGFGDGDGLLLHGFVDRGAVLVVHFVEFVDQAGAAVGEDEGAAFKRPFGG